MPSTNSQVNRLDTSPKDFVLNMSSDSQKNLEGDASANVVDTRDPHQGITKSR